MTDNRTHWHRYWIGVIIASAIIHILSSCTIFENGGYSLAELDRYYNQAYSHQDSVTVYQVRGVWEEADTVVNNDTLYHWK